MPVNPIEFEEDNNSKAINMAKVALDLLEVVKELTVRVEEMSERIKILEQQTKYYPPATYPNPTITTTNPYYTVDWGTSTSASNPNNYYISPSTSYSNRLYDVASTFEYDLPEEETEILSEYIDNYIQYIKDKRKD